MERVVKRFLMHSQSDFDDPKQNEYDEFKQDLQLIRYEIVNNFKKAREDNLRNMFLINTGLEYLVEELANRNETSKSNTSQFQRYKELLNSYSATPTKIEPEITNIATTTTSLSNDIEKISESIKETEEIQENTTTCNVNKIEILTLKIDLNEIEKVENSSS